MEIKVLGTGCSSCKALYETTKQAISELGCDATLIKEEELSKIKEYNIYNKWWVVNACLSLTDTENSFLRAKAQNELVWIKKVEELSKGNAALIAWKNN